MKKVLIILLFLFTASCATTQIHVKKYPKLTLKSAQNECTLADTFADNVWSFNIMGLEIMAALLDDCHGIKSLFVIAADAENYDEVVRRLSLNLAAIHFTTWRANVDDTKKWYLKKIKEQHTNEWLVFFYELSSKELDCTNGVCKLKE